MGASEPWAVEFWLAHQTLNCSLSDADPLTKTSRMQQANGSFEKQPNNEIGRQASNPLPRKGRVKDT